MELHLRSGLRRVALARHFSVSLRQRLFHFWNRNSKEIKANRKFIVRTQKVSQESFIVVGPHGIWDVISSHFLHLALWGSSLLQHPPLRPQVFALDYFVLARAPGFFLFMTLQFLLLTPCD